MVCVVFLEIEFVRFWFVDVSFSKGESGGMKLKMKVCLWGVLSFFVFSFRVLGSRCRCRWDKDLNVLEKRVIGSDIWIFLLEEFVV